MRRRARPVGMGASGQSATETLIAMSFVFMVMAALIHLVLLASTRHLVNYAAFAGSRAALYGTSRIARPFDPPQDRLAVRDVTRIINWGRPAAATISVHGYEVRYPVPIGLPLFNRGGTVTVTGRVPLLRQPAIAERGDNAERPAGFLRLP